MATCFFSFNSLMTRSWSVSEREGAASWRSRIFCCTLSVSKCTFLVEMSAGPIQLCFHWC